VILSPVCGHLFVFHRSPADCSENGGFLDRSAGFRFCHFQKTTAPDNAV